MKVLWSNLFYVNCWWLLCAVRCKMLCVTHTLYLDQSLPIVWGPAWTVLETYEDVGENLFNKKQERKRGQRPSPCGLYKLSHRLPESQGLPAGQCWTKGLTPCPSILRHAVTLQVIKWATVPDMHSHMERENWSLSVASRKWCRLFISEDPSSFDLHFIRARMLWSSSMLFLSRRLFQWEHLLIKPATVHFG